MNEESNVTARVVKWIVGGITALFLVIVASCAANTVETGHRGIKVNFGKVEPQPLPEGLYFVNPFTTHIAQLSIQTIKWDATTEAYTKDVQKSVIHFALNYSLEPGYAAEIYRTVGATWSETLIPQVVNEEIKRQIGQIEAVQLIASRDQIARSIEKLVTDNLASRHVLVSGFRMTNIDYTTEFENAVEAKVVAQQKAIEETNRTVQIQQQANQKVITAQAEAKSMQIRAEALSQNPKLVEWEAVQKWNGTLPQYMLGGATPFMNLTPAR